MCHICQNINRVSKVSAKEESAWKHSFAPRVLSYLFDGCMLACNHFTVSFCRFIAFLHSRPNYNCQYRPNGFQKLEQNCLKVNMVSAVRAHVQCQDQCSPVRSSAACPPFLFPSCAVQDKAGLFVQQLIVGPTC